MDIAPEVSLYITNPQTLSQMQCRCGLDDFRTRFGNKPIPILGIRWAWRWNFPL